MPLKNLAPSFFFSFIFSHLPSPFSFPHLCNSLFLWCDSPTKRKPINSHFCKRERERDKEEERSSLNPNGFLIHSSIPRSTQLAAAGELTGTVFFPFQFCDRTLHNEFRSSKINIPNSYTLLLFVSILNIPTSTLIWFPFLLAFENVSVFVCMW